MAIAIPLRVSEGRQTVPLSAAADPAVPLSARPAIQPLLNTDYRQLQNKPSINGKMLEGGENALRLIGVDRASSADIDKLF